MSYLRVAAAALLFQLGVANAAEAPKLAAKPATPAVPATPVAPVPPPPLVDPAAIDSALKSMVDSKSVVGVSALVYERGREAYFGAFGLADRENNKPMARDTIVQIFSMTKPITGVALMQLYERGKFDLFFLADGLVSAANDHPSMQTRLEPTTTVAALSFVARNIGFGCTVSTSFSDPFSVARVFQSLAHITKGRVAWNIVTSNSPDAHLNFSRETQVEHDQRIRAQIVAIQRVQVRGADP